MKASYREYHSYTKPERTKLWKDSLIVFDTNVYLDLYSYGKDTLDDYFNVLTEAKKRDQLWMPHRVGFEFFERRVGIISRQQNVYDSILGYLQSPSEKISNLINSTGVHAHLDFKEISSKYDNSVKKLTSEIEKLKNAHPDHLGNDDILERLEKIYTNTLIGKPHSKEQINELVKEGDDRYSKHIPPGYRDGNKAEDEGKPDAHRKYGDLIMWKQIIDKAKDSQKSIIFVTNDAKDDWVQYAKDKRRLGPQPALRKEMLDEAGVDFELYSSDEFLEAAREYLGVALQSGSVEEVQKYLKLESERQMEARSNFIGLGSDLGFESTRSRSRTRRVLLAELERALFLCNEIRAADSSKLKHTLEVANLQDAYKKIRNDILHHVLERRNYMGYEGLLLEIGLTLHRSFAESASSSIRKLMHVNGTLLDIVRELRDRHTARPWGDDERSAWETLISDE